MSIIRGVLVAGRFRTHHQLTGVSNDDQRNILIVELAGRTNQSGAHFQAMDDFTLAGAGAVYVFLREARIRTEQQLKSISDDDQRNILIVEIGAQTGLGSQLQGFDNIELVLLGLGKARPGDLRQGSFLRGVLLAGKFRTQHEVNGMSSEDQRNTLIVELAGRTSQSGAHFQAMDDFTLAGAGAVYVFLREARIRTEQQLKSVSDDDQRNILIVEIGAQTGLGSRLQGLRNMDIVRLGLGVDPADVFKALPGPLQPLPTRFVFSVDSVEIHTQKADNDHSDSDWLSIIVSIGNAATKDQPRILEPKLVHIGDVIKSGNVIVGPFKTDAFDAEDTDVVLITYVLTNLGSSRIEDQGREAVQITNKVVSFAGPIVGTAVGLFFGQPAEGFKIGQQVAKIFDGAIAGLSDVFDFLGIHFGPANCNGVVLSNTLTFGPGELAQAAGRPASLQGTGPQENDRCGSPPITKVNFSIHRVPFTG